MRFVFQIYRIVVERGAEEVVFDDGTKGDGAIGKRSCGDAPSARANR